MAQLTHPQLLNFWRAAAGVCLSWGTSLLAALTLTMIVFGTVLLWPIPDLGFAHNLATYEVEQVVPGSAADHAGLQVGDRMLSLYGRPMAEVIRSVQVIAWIPPRDQPIPMVIERAGHIPYIDTRRSQPRLSGL